HTRWPRDWSSDVCSSDLEGELVNGALEEEEGPTFLHEIVVAWLLRTLGPWVRRRRGQVTGSETKVAVGPRRGWKPDVAVFLAGQIGRASCRERVWSAVVG